MTKLQHWLHRLETPKHFRIDLGLSRVKKIATALDLLNFDCPVITVGGTNGKGSTVACLESIAVAADLKVASFTSPHIFTVNERIRLNRKPIDDKALCLAFECIDSVEGSELLSYFEWLTLAALVTFKNVSLDLIVLEVGLGGRLDASNIIDAEVSIITSLALDHQEYLGETIADIAKEKAGIFRKNRLALLGQAEHIGVIEPCAKSIGANLSVIGRDVLVTLFPDSRFTIDYQDKKFAKLPTPKIILSNAICAITAIDSLGLGISEQSIKQGLLDIKLTGRCEFITIEGKQLVIDVAHNPAAMSILARRLKSFNFDRIHVVIGMMLSKDIQASLDTLKGVADKWYCGKLDTELSASEKHFDAFFERANVNNWQYFSTLLDAFLAAQDAYQAGDCIVVTGSFFSLAAIRQHLTSAISH